MTQYYRATLNAKRVIAFGGSVDRLIRLLCIGGQMARSCIGTGGRVDWKLPCETGTARCGVQMDASVLSGVARNWIRHSSDPPPLARLRNRGMYTE